MELPVFRYHPDPIASGSIVVSDKACACCGKARGFVYTASVYCEAELDDEALCPWCIADGSAHEKFDASFTDFSGLPDNLPPDIAEEIAFRTPGFSTWQSERWLGCCGDAAAFLEPVGTEELRARHPKLDGVLMGFIVYDLQISGRAAVNLLENLHRDRGPTAYVFSCRHCDNQPAYIDLP